MRTLVATLIALMLFAAPPVAADDFDDGVAAFSTGDNQKAVRPLMPYAEQRHAMMQNFISAMYAEDLGVPTDAAKPVYWQTRAAKQWSARAQLGLCLSCWLGKGVPEDYVRAYAWASIVAAQGNARGNTSKEALLITMTPGQIAEGQKLSREFWKKYVVPFQKK